MQRSDHRIWTTHTGSLPRPPALVPHLVDIDRGEAAAAELRGLPLLDQAVRDIVRRQVEVGLDLVNDGEMSKYGYSTYVKERLSGFAGEHEGIALADLADFPDFAATIRLEFRAPCCIGPIDFCGQDSVERDITRLRPALAEAGRTRGFLTAASPGIIAAFLHNRYYSSEEAYLYAIAEAMKPEYDAIARAGFILQLDCPDLALGRHLSVPPLSIEAFRKRVALHVEVLDHAVRDIPPEQLRMHLCWGNYPSPHHHDIELRHIIDLVLAARPQGLLFEAANPRHAHEWRVFRDVPLPDGKLLIPGVIDSCTPYVEHPELVAQRIEAFAGVVGRENVMAGTDCGFATFATFHNIDPGIAWLKLRALVEGAEIASRRLW